MAQILEWLSVVRRIAALPLSSFCSSSGPCSTPRRVSRRRKVSFDAESGQPLASKMTLVSPPILSRCDDTSHFWLTDTVPPTAPQIGFALANAQELPKEGFEDNSFDLYTIAFGIRNCTNIPLVLQEAHRVLKPGGRFACLEFGKVENPILSQ